MVLMLSLEGRKDRKVGLISGGGSGHEPSHAGFVGDGDVCCHLWSSLSLYSDKFLETIRVADEGAEGFHGHQELFW